MNLEHLSHSSLSTADDCMKKFYLTRVSEDRMPSMPSGPRDIGILAHRYVEAFFKGEDFLKALSEQDHSYDHAEAMSIFSGWKRRFTIPEEDWLYSERYGEATVNGVPLKVIGYDDFIYKKERAVRIRDFKSGWGTEIYEEYNIQGDLACLRYEQEFGEQEDLGSEVEFIRRGIVTEPRLWSPALRAATVDRVRGLWEKIKSEVWEATPGKHCTRCDFITECAKGRRAQSATLVVNSPENALEALREIVLMDEAIAAMKAALKPYCDAHGTVETGVGKYDYQAGYKGGGETRSFKDVTAVLAITGLNLGKGALKIDGKVKAGAALFDDPRLVDLIETKITKPRFNVGKKSDKEDENGDV
jgi:hypothetical protein